MERARLVTRMVLSEQAERMLWDEHMPAEVNRTFDAIDAFVNCRPLDRTDRMILRSIATDAERRLPGMVRALEAFLEEEDRNTEAAA